MKHESIAILLATMCILPFLYLLMKNESIAILLGIMCILPFLCLLIILSIEDRLDVYFKNFLNHIKKILDII